MSSLRFLNYKKLGIKEFSGLSTFQFLAYFRRSIFYTFLSIYLRLVLGLSTTETTLMATIGMIANTSTQMWLWGPLLDKTRRNAGFVIIGEAVAGFGHFVIFWWHRSVLAGGDKQLSGYTIIIGLAIVEIFWSMSNNGWSALISEYTEDRERKQLMSQLSVIGGIGGILGAMTGGFLYDGGIGFSEGMMFYVAGIFMILSAVLVIFTVKDRAKVDPNEPKEEVDESTTFKDLSPIVRKTYIVFLIGLVFLNFGRNSMAVISSFYIADPTGFAATDSQVALFRNVASATTMVVGFALGSTLSKIDDSKVLMSGVLASMLYLLGMVFAPSFELALIASALNGAAMVIVQASSYAIVASIIPVHMRGRLFAYYNTTFFLSWGLAATFITAPIADYLIWVKGYTNVAAYKVSFFVATGLVVIAALTLLYSFTLLRKVDEEKYALIKL
ncbi:MAG: MFS transporter [Candidatus Heimdallarchaeota archaeon]|nr:MFS transporter [Candidatus Heimdallarchaeota archaeon]